MVVWATSLILANGLDVFVQIRDDLGDAEHGKQTRVPHLCKFNSPKNMIRTRRMESIDVKYLQQSFAQTQSPLQLNSTQRCDSDWILANPKKNLKEPRFRKVGCKRQVTRVSPRRTQMLWYISDGFNIELILCAGRVVRYGNSMIIEQTIRSLGDAAKSTHASKFHEFVGIWKEGETCTSWTNEGFWFTSLKHL